MRELTLVSGDRSTPKEPIEIQKALHWRLSGVDIDHDHLTDQGSTPELLSSISDDVQLAKKGLTCFRCKTFLKSKFDQIQIKQIIPPAAVQHAVVP